MIKLFKELKNGTNKNDYFTYNYDEKYILIK